MTNLNVRTDILILGAGVNAMVCVAFCQHYNLSYKVLALSAGLHSRNRHFTITPTTEKIFKKLNNDNSLVYVLTGDGELQEGQNWEAFMYASANKVDNIIVTVDYNGQQIDGSTKDVLDIGNLKLKLESFNWKVLEIENGNSLDEVYQIMSEAIKASMKEKPIVILMKTIMGNGVDFMMHSHKWHGVAPNDEQLEKALNQNPETLGDY